ncbi:MAG: von Willebrand factor type A domain-containing protein [Gemmatimonadaceae bacterium]
MSFTRTLARRGGVSTLFAAALLTTPGSIAVPHGGARQTVVTGRVLDPAGQPVQSAAVSIRERTTSTTSGRDGRYTLTVSRTTDRDQVTLLARSIGYQARTMTLILSADTVRVDIRLNAQPVRLEETVATGAASKVAADELRSRVAAAPREQPLMTRTSGVSLSKSGAIVSRGALRIEGDRRNTRLRADSGGNTEAYDHIDENPFRSPRVAPMSTFSVDVDRASYSNVRRFLAGGQLPPKDAVRIEELVNYFPYGDPAPASSGAPLRVSTELAAAPWNPTHDLLRIALRARDVDMRRAPPSNLVFLVDVSGSMQGPGRLPLVQQALGLLVNELREEDRVAITVYAGSAGLVLPSTSGADKQKIMAALDGLEAGGSTAGGAGIKLAYDVAQKHFIAGGNNRVVLCTDGDFNVGQSSDGELVRLIEQRRTEGSFLTILGFGMGNYKDAKMEKLAGAGNGNYGYIDDLLEARKMLVKEMGGTLLTVAKDVKLQVEFNPARVQAYRLLGYEDRLLRDEDFANDVKDAGDVGAGHTVTALYEIVPTGTPLDVTLPPVAGLRYQRVDGAESPRNELLHVALRYKAPDGEKSTLMTYPVGAERTRPSEAMRFASAVAGFGMLLRESPNAGTLTWSQMLSLARGAKGSDEDGYRADFIRMGEMAASLAKPDKVGMRER